MIKRQAADASEYERDKLFDRVAKLGGGVAVIKIGAATETEMKEAKYRMEDISRKMHLLCQHSRIGGINIFKFCFLRGSDTLLLSLFYLNQDVKEKQNAREDR